MNLQIPDHVMRWLGITVIINVFIWVVTWTPEANYALCTRTDNCLVSWVSALSGWAAAAGAIYAANVTLRPLLRQVDEARRQTDYIVGDAEPEFVLQRHRREDRLVLRATNLNRRQVMVESMSVTHPPELEVMRYYASELKPGKKDQPIVRVAPWRNRNKEAPHRYIRIALSQDGIAANGIAASGRAITMTISFRIVGQQQERRTTTVSAVDLDDYVDV